MRELREIHKRLANLTKQVTAQKKATTKLNKLLKSVSFLSTKRKLTKMTRRLRR
jgi:uncharacterized coiled-coil protein SlyX